MALQEPLRCQSQPSLSQDEEQDSGPPGFIVVVEKFVGIASSALVSL